MLLSLSYFLEKSQLPNFGRWGKVALLRDLPIPSFPCIPCIPWLTSPIPNGRAGARPSHDPTPLETEAHLGKF